MIKRNQRRWLYQVAMRARGHDGVDARKYCLFDMSGNFVPMWPPEKTTTVPVGPPGKKR